jgi:uncharacterized membrane protein
MIMLDWLFVVSLFFHLLATVVWIGGLVLMTVLVWPEARNALAQGTNPALMTYLDRLRNRFNPLATLSLIVLIVTGLYQMARDPNYEGVLQFNNTWSRAILIKHIAVIGMIIAGAVMQWSVIPAIERANLYLSQGKKAPNLPDVESLRRRERRLVVVNCALGVLVLMFTAIATSV